MYTDEEAYRQALAGDQDAAAQLVDRYGDPLTLYLDSRLGDWHAAEDLMIESFSLLFAKARPIDGTGSFQAYLYVRHEVA